MELLLKVDASWPPGHSELGIKNGNLTQPENLESPLEVEFDEEHTIVTPAWINAHSHMELSACDPVEFTGNMTDWLQDVIQLKKSLDAQQIVNNYKQWANKLVASGTPRIVDHCDRTDLLFDAVQELPAEVWLCKELIGFSPDQVEEQKDVARSHLEALENRALGGGLAPHAPYSAHPDLYSYSGRQSQNQQLVVSTHLHEIKAELEFARSGDGPLRELLRQRGVEKFETPYEGSPLTFLAKNGFFQVPMFGVHLNYLSDEDYRWLESSSVCPVFCPNSYFHFGHETLPVAQWFARGVDFALGTDSRCSNRELDMLSELRTLHQLAPEIQSPEILEALTVNPARVMGLPEAAVLTPGTPADISVFNVPAGELDALARGQAEAVAAFLQGECLWSSEPELNSEFFQGAE